MSAVQPARACIEYTCRLLRSYGIELKPELVRQAKFNAAAACKPLLQSLYDLALCVAAGLPRGVGEGITVLRQQLQQETVDGGLLREEGLILLLHLLASWGCPAGLLAQLSLPCRSSRTTLLALAWLVGHARLFDRALQHLQLPQQLLQLLPPYPEDTSTTADAQPRYTAAAAAAQQHTHKIQELLQSEQSQQAAADGSSWRQVQAAAHHLLATYRGASMRLQLLSSLQEGREKLLHQIQQMQAGQQQQQQQQRSHEGTAAPSEAHAGSSHIKHLRASASSSSSSSRGLPAAAYGVSSSSKASRKGPVLTAFELHLLSNPQLLAQHEQALQQACSLLQQQLQCMQATQTFFAWASSVIDEEQKSTAEAAAGAPAGAAAANTGAVQAHQQQQQRQQRQEKQRQEQQELLIRPAVADILPLLRQLPPADSPLAAQVLQRIVQQLQQAAAQAGISLSSSSSSAAAAAALSVLSLNEVQQGRGSDVSPANGSDCEAAALSGYSQAAAVALIHSGVVPGVQQELVAVPEDIQLQLDTQQQQQQQQSTAGHSLGQQQDRKHVWQRQQVSSEQLSMLLAQHRAQQQQQQQEQHSGRAADGPAAAFGAQLPGLGDINQVGCGLRALGLGNTPIAVAGVTAVPVTAELQRQHGLALHVAKQLAKVRAGHKQHLQAASDMLLGGAACDDPQRQQAGSSSEAGKLVLYKT